MLWCTDMWPVGIEIPLSNLLLINQIKASSRTIESRRRELSAEVVGFDFAGFAP